MMNEEDDHNGLVRFKPSESRMRLYMVKQEGDNASFDIEGALLDIVSILKSANWEKSRFIDVCDAAWDSAEIVHRFPSEKKQ